MATIKVEDIPTALEKLQALMGIDLGVAPDTSPQLRSELDTASLGKYLENLLGPASDISVRQFQHGQSNPTFLVKYDGLDGTCRQMVVRKKPPGKLLPGAHAVEREYRVIDALGRAGVPVPKLIALCTDEAVLGTPFYLMEYVKGKIYKDPALPGINHDDRSKIYAAMSG